MVVNKKALMLAMKDGIKGAGYEVADNGKQLIINGHKWAVVLNKQETDKEILGLLVTHMGMLPESGSAYSVRKQKTEILVQDMAYDVAMEPIGRMLADSEKLTNANAVGKTIIMFGTWNVWQPFVGTNTATLVDPVLERIMKLDTKSTVYRMGEFMTVADGAGNLVCIARGKARDAEQLELARWPKVTY